MKIVALVFCVGSSSAAFAQSNTDQHLDCHNLGVLAYVMQEGRSTGIGIARAESMTSQAPFRILGHRWTKVADYVQGRGVSIASPQASPAMISAQVFLDCLRGDFR